MTSNKLNAGIIGLAKRVAGLLIRPPSRESQAVTTGARAGSLAVALVLLGVGAPGEVQGVEELLETLIPVLPTSTGSGIPVTGTVPLRQGATYRVVVTGIITITIPPPPPPSPQIPRVDRYDARCLLSQESGPDNAFGSVGISVFGNIIAGEQGVRLPFNCNPANRYEVTFVSNLNGVLRTSIAGPPTGLLTIPRPTDTSTIRVELFGERVEFELCGGRPATTEAIPEVPTFGTPGNDVIVGTEGADQLFGLGGRDIICGLGGNDVISGNSGLDRLFGGPGDDQITGGDDNARDFLFGEDGQDRLNGGKGNDILDGGPGVDRMIGGLGNDKMFVNGVGVVINTDGTFTRQGDVLLGGPGEDLADYSQLSRGVRVDLGRGNRKQPGGEILKGIENLRGTDFDDQLSGDDGDNELLGEDGNDRLDGRGFGIDQLDGGSDAIVGPEFDTCIIDPEDERPLFPGDRENVDTVKDCEIVQGR